MAVDPAQQMVCWDVIIKAEVVEELRRSRLTSHHSRLIPCKSLRGLNHASQAPAMASFSTQSAQKRSPDLVAELCDTGSN
ncbi:hypothetical protein [Rhizobium sp. LjRoot258]|uniref:hypothetical protein n=1 Tax=Rhizobium sp. LjRoot258 TaxID=3342299 RepID=UPI003ED0AD57